MSDQSAPHSSQTTKPKFNPVLSASATNTQGLLPGRYRSHDPATRISVPSRDVHARLAFVESGHLGPYERIVSSRRDVVNQYQPTNLHQRNQEHDSRGRGRGRSRSRDGISQSSAQPCPSAASSNQAVTNSTESNARPSGNSIPKATIGSAVITESGDRQNAPTAKVAGRKRSLSQDMVETSEAKKRQLANNTKNQRPLSSTASRAHGNSIHEAINEPGVVVKSKDEHNARIDIRAVKFAGIKRPRSEDTVDISHTKKRQPLTDTKTPQQNIETRTARMVKRPKKRTMKEAQIERVGFEPIVISDSDEEDAKSDSKAATFAGRKRALLEDLETSSITKKNIICATNAYTTSGKDASCSPSTSSMASSTESSTSSMIHRTTIIPSVTAKSHDNERNEKIDEAKDAKEEEDKSAKNTEKEKFTRKEKQNVAAAKKQKEAKNDRFITSLQYKAEGYPTLHIERRDVDKLKEGEFLNDTIIDFYLRYLHQSIRAEDPTLHGDIYMYNSFFYAHLVHETDGFNYEHVRRWFRKIDIFKKRYALMPVCLESHWFLAILVNLQNCLGSKDLDASEEPRIYLLDSLGVNRVKEGRHIARYLECLAADRCPTEHFRCPNVSNVPVPKQTNEYDCGIYVLQFAESFLSSPARALSAIKKKETTYWDTSAVSQKRLTIKKIIKKV